MVWYGGLLVFDGIVGQTFKFFSLDDTFGKNLKKF